jgi:hypothetical protein
MVAEGVNRNATHFRIFTAEIILRDKRLDLIPHGFIDCHLACNRSAARGFGTTASFQQRAPIMAFNATHFCCTLTPGKRPVQPALESFDGCRLLARYLRSRPSYFAR